MNNTKIATLKTKKVWHKRMWAYIACGVLIALSLFLLMQGTECHVAVIKSRDRLAAYGADTAALNYGNMTYVDKGEGEVILSIHGICGGYDQGFDNAANKVSDYRIIAPSRFGYLGSDAPDDPSPKKQAKAFVELLDILEIDKVFLFATSAGGTVAIRFALDYPERTKGLILISTTAPYYEKPVSYQEYQGPPKFLCNNFGMWLLRPFFKPLMGMESDTIYGMLPMNERLDGTLIDATVTNIDMARSFYEYEIEDLKVPSIIFQAKDDLMAKYEMIEQSIDRFPNCIFIVFETGGHLLVGNSEEINKAMDEFLNEHKSLRSALPF